MEGKLGAGEIDGSRAPTKYNFGADKIDGKIALKNSYRKNRPPTVAR